jgi:uncharacterized protein YndB with AHSA1/START domain
VNVRPLDLDPARAGRLVEGASDGGDGRPAIEFARRLAADPVRVWRAVTDPEELGAWFPCRVVGERRVGATLRFVFGDGPDDAAGADEGVVTAWEPPTSWAFVWGGFPVRISVEPADDGDGGGGGTVLRFRQGLPEDRSSAARQAAGWDVCLDGLDRHLGGGAAAADAPQAAPDAWRARYERYLRTTPAAMGTVSSSTSITWHRSHHADVDKVWRCLTDGDEVSAWWGAPISIDLRLGGLVRFDFRPAAEPFDGVIVALEEGRRFAYTFGAPSSVVEWTLAPAEEGTDFTLTHHDVEASVRGQEEFDVPGTAAGWHGLLHQLDLYAAAGQAAVGADDEPARRHDYAALLTEPQRDDRTPVR